MRREDALKKLTKLLGPKLGYRVNLKAPDAEARADAQERLKIVRETHDEIERRRKERAEELLGGDELYQQLRHEVRVLTERRDELVGASLGYRFTAGTMGQFFFSVAAYGDSWEEVIAMVQEKKQKGQLP